MWISSLFQIGMRKLFILGLVSSIAACGGGGGDKKPSPVPASASPISSSSSSSLSSSVSSLSMINSSSVGLLNGSISSLVGGASSINSSSSSSLSNSSKSSISSVIVVPTDTTPDAFSFTAFVTGALNTPLISNVITVSGINTAVPISITNGEYSIDGGTFTSEAGTVSNGQTVALKLMSAATIGAETHAVITIGGVAKSFSGTTANLIGGAIQNAPLNIAGVVTTVAGATPAADGVGTAVRFNVPAGSVSVGNYLYVVDSQNHKIRKIEKATGVVTTLAGSGSSGNVDGIGAQASFYYPAGITTDGTHLYVADTINHKIRKIEIATGDVITLAGSGSSGSADGTGAAASFDQPNGITTDGTHLFVADTNNNKIRKIEIATGVVTTLAGSVEWGSADGTGVAASFYLPAGITTNGTRLYVADSGNDKIRRIEIATGVVTTLAGSDSDGEADGTGVAASFRHPGGITTDGTHLYVADSYNSKIRKIEITTGVVTTLAGSGSEGDADGTGAAASFRYPHGVSTDGTYLYISDAGNDKIRKIVIATGIVNTLAGNGSSRSADGAGAAANFSVPQGITTDGIHLYVTDANNNKIRKIEIATGVVTTLAGSGSSDGADGTGAAASFDNPYGITTDGKHLYGADFNNHKIRKIEINTGVVTTLAGSGSGGSVDGVGTAASFNRPEGITTDGTFLYVADTFNHKIRKIEINTGVVSTLAGSSYGVADGTGAAASFNYPEGITTDGTYLYVADTGNYRIRTIEINTGVVTTLAGNDSLGSVDGVGTAASFYYPFGITTDGTYVYVADIANNIRTIEIASGAVTTLAGSGSEGSDDGVGTAAKFRRPSGITTDGFALFVTDSNNNTIRKIE